MITFFLQFLLVCMESFRFLEISAFHSSLNNTCNGLSSTYGWSLGILLLDDAVLRLFELDKDVADVSLHNLQLKS